MTVDTRCCTAAVRSRRQSRGTRTVPGPADAAEVVAQDVDDHHVLGAVLGARQKFARERPILRGVAPARTSALDRIGLDDAFGIDRQERLGRGGEECSRTPGQLPRPEIDERREQRRITRPKVPVELPRITVERGLEPAGEVGLVQVAAGDVVADPGDVVLVRGPVHPRPEAERRRHVIGLRPGVRASGRHQQPCMDVIEAARQPASVAIERATADPGVTGLAVPGDDPIVEGEPKHRQVLVRGCDSRKPLEHRPEVVAEEPDEPSQEWRRIGRDHDRPVESRDEPSSDREWIGTRRGRFEDRDRIGRQIRPARIAPGSGALEEDQPVEIAERLRGIDRSKPGDPIGQPAEAERRADTGRRDHRRMIRPVAVGGLEADRPNVLTGMPAARPAQTPTDRWVMLRASS